MNCVNHPDVAAVAYCRECGKPLCGSCQVTAYGTVYCAEHAPATAASAGSSYADNPYAAPPPPPPPAPGASPYTASAAAAAVGTPSPGLAFLLGFIPGVGAIYNGQYAKGVIHVVILGLLMSIADAPGSSGLEPLFVLLSVLWFFYMAFEAYHTAVKRLRGEPVDEFSSLFSLQGRGSSGHRMAGPVVMIMLGVIFLLNTLGVLRFYEIIQYWPVLLIILGVYLLWIRVAEQRRTPSDTLHSGTPREAVHER